MEILHLEFCDIKHLKFGRFLYKDKDVLYQITQNQVIFYRSPFWLDNVNKYLRYISYTTRYIIMDTTKENVVFEGSGTIYNIVFGSIKYIWRNEIDRKITSCFTDYGVWVDHLTWNIFGTPYFVLHIKRKILFPSIENNGIITHIVFLGNYKLTKRTFILLDNVFLK